MSVSKIGTMLSAALSLLSNNVGAQQSFDFAVPVSDSQLVGSTSVTAIDNVWDDFEKKLDLKNRDNLIDNELSDIYYHNMSAVINKTHVPEGKMIVNGWEAHWFNLTNHSSPYAFDFPIDHDKHVNFVQNLDFLKLSDFKNASDHMIANTHFAAIFKTNLIIDKAGIYTFQLSAEDKGKAFLDGKLMINNWQHMHIDSGMTKVMLTKGVHKIDIQLVHAQNDIPKLMFMYMGEDTVADGQQRQFHLHGFTLQNDPHYIEVNPISAETNITVNGWMMKTFYLPDPKADDMTNPFDQISLTKMTANKTDFVPNYDMIGSTTFRDHMNQTFPSGVNHIGIIYESRIHLNITGDYHFLIEASPGGRIHENGKLLLDQWKDTTLHDSISKTAELLHVHGNKTIVIEYILSKNDTKPMLNVAYKGPDTEYIYAPLKSSLPVIINKGLYDTYQNLTAASSTN